MKNLRLFALTAIVAIVSISGYNAQAQILRFGPKVGVTVNSFHFDSSTFDSNNRTGWTAGAMMEVNVPVIGLSADLSAMYVRSNAKVSYADDNARLGSDYFEIPLNVKYKFGIPAVSNFVLPYLYTGPGVAFLTSRKAVKEAFNNKSVDWNWNIGAGLQLVNHLQLSVNYGMGLNNALKVFGGDDKQVKAKRNCITVSAAYLF